MTQEGNLAGAIEAMTPVYERLADDPAASGTVLLLAEELARAHVYHNKPEVARDYAVRALQLAEARADWPRMVSLLSRYGVIWMGQGIPTGGLALLRAAVDLARSRHLPDAMVVPLVNVAAFQATRDLPASLAAGRESVEVAVRVGARDRVGTAGYNLAAALWLAGDWAEIPGLYAEYGRPSGRRLDEVSLRFLLTRVLWARGDLAASRELAAQPVPPEGGDPQAEYFGLLAAAALAEAEGSADEESRLTVAAVTVMHENFDIDDDFGLAWPWAVEAALAADDVGRADTLVRLVADAPAGLVSTYLHAQLLRLRALVAAAKDDGERVDDDLAAAIEELRGFGASFYLGRALLERGRRLVDRGDATSAAPLLAESAALFDRLGALPWVTRAERAGALVDG